MTTAHFDLAQAFMEGKALNRQAIENLVKALKGTNPLATARRVLDQGMASPAPTASRTLLPPTLDNLRAKLKLLLAGDSLRHTSPQRFPAHLT